MTSTRTLFSQIEEHTRGLGDVSMESLGSTGSLASTDSAPAAKKHKPSKLLQRGGARKTMLSWVQKSVGRSVSQSVWTGQLVWAGQSVSQAQAVKGERIHLIYLSRELKDMSHSIEFGHHTHELLQGSGINALNTSVCWSSAQRLRSYVALRQLKLSSSYGALV